MVGIAAESFLGRFRGSIMKFGIFDHVEQRRDVPLDQQYRERLDLLMQADQGGIYGYHVAEHHHSPLSIAPCHAPYFAAVAANTGWQRSGDAHPGISLGCHV